MGLVPAAPSWLIAKLQPQHRRPADTTPAVDELDTDYARQRALVYLSQACTAVEGAGGDTLTYQVAAKVKDYGISETECLNLMAEYWNDRCSPPWSPDELQTKVANAYQYGQNPPGIDDPRADFPDPIEPLDIPTEHTDEIPLKATLIEPFEATSIPPRRWILGNLLLARKVSMLIAQAGMGKSTLGIGVALSVVAGLEKTTAMHVHESTKVWLINNEDDTDELKRRLAAYLQHFGIPWDALRGRLYLDSGEQRRLVIARKRHDGLVRPVDRDAIVDILRREEIGVLVVDPVVETVDGLSENSNEDMIAALSYYRDIAQRANCAVLLVHHTRKLPQASADGHAGNMDSARGASSMVGVARVVGTLYGMSPKDAKAFGIQQDKRHYYVRYDDAKANLALASPKARWFKRIGVDLGQGDEVGVLEPITLEAKVQPENDLILEALVHAMEDEPRRRLRTVANEIAEENRAVLLAEDTGRAMGWGGVQKRLQKLLGEPWQSGSWEYRLEVKDGLGNERQAHWIVREWCE